MDGQQAVLEVLTRAGLADRVQVLAQSDHPHAVFWTTWAELLALTGGRPVQVA